MTIRGSCHCGAIAYRLDETPTQAIDCNCSHCRRKGYLLAFTTPDKFQLETPREALRTYTFNRHVIRHHFCGTCGCAPFGEGEGPNGPTIAINLRCADVDLDTLEIVPFDGASR
ncbi:MAG TPA: GFA family protein [Allosphingosinicella sp.]